MIGHLPAVVREPTRQVHVTIPLPSASLDSSPLALLGPDL